MPRLAVYKEYIGFDGFTPEEIQSSRNEIVKIILDHLDESPDPQRDIETVKYIINAPLDENGIEFPNTHIYMNLCDWIITKIKAESPRNHVLEVTFMYALNRISQNQGPIFADYQL